MTRPVAVVTDASDLDPRPGIALLTEAGFDVHVLAWDRERVAAAARNLLAWREGRRR